MKPRPPVDGNPSSLINTSTEPVLLLGTSRREHLERWLLQAFEAWRQEWAANGNDPVQVELAHALNRSAPGADGHRHIDVTAASEATGHLVTISLAVDGQGELFGFNAVRHAVDVAESVGHCVIVEALQALCSRLTRRDGIVDVSFGPSPQTSMYSLDATLRCDSGRALLRFRFSANLLFAVLPKARPTPSAGLATRRSAIAEEPVHIEAWLGETEVTLAELAKLQMGDVLLLSTSLAGAAHLSVLDETSKIPLRIGRVGQHRAVSPTAAVR